MSALMNAGRGVVLLLVASVLYACLRILYNIFLHPLRRFPGPLIWKAARLTWVVRLQQGYLHQDLLRLHDKYGPVVRTAPDELSYIDARAWKDIYASKPGQSLLERGAIWFQKTRPTDPVSIMGYNEDDHARYRRAFTAAFTDRAIKDQAPLIERYVDLMMRRLKEMAVNGGGGATVDIVDWLNFTTFDVSGEMSFGESFGSTEEGKAHPWVDISCRFGKGIALIASINHYAPLQKLLKYIIPAKVREKAAYHRELSAQKVQQRLAQGEGKPDFINSVLRYNQNKKEKVTPEELEVNMMVFVFAGSETTGTAISATIFELLNHPEALHKTAEEIRSAFSTDDDINLATTSRLEYLTAVIKEGMRLGPPSVIGVPRVTPAGGAEICGKHVPAGTFVAINQYPAFRSAQNFSDPDEFVPERFLGEQTPYSEDNLDIFEPFLVGRHQCIGHRFAWAEMRLILARLIYTFDISWVEQSKSSSWGEQQTFIFWQKDPLMLKLTTRL